MEEVYIVSAVRTPIGSFNGTLSGFTATELGSLVIGEAIHRAGIAKEQVDEVIMGNVLPGGLGQNPARQAMLKAGLPYEVGAITVNKVCGSGLKSVMLAAQAIAAERRRGYRGRRSGEHEPSPLFPGKGPDRLPHGQRDLIR